MTGECLRRRGSSRPADPRPCRSRAAIRRPAVGRNARRDGESLSPLEAFAVREPFEVPIRAARHGSRAAPAAPTAGRRRADGRRRRLPGSVNRPAPYSEPRLGRSGGGAYHEMTPPTASEPEYPAAARADRRRGGNWWCCLRRSSTRRRTRKRSRRLRAGPRSRWAHAGAVPSAHAVTPTATKNLPRVMTTLLRAGKSNDAAIGRAADSRGILSLYRVPDAELSCFGNTCVLQTCRARRRPGEWSLIRSAF